MLPATADAEIMRQIKEVSTTYGARDLVKDYILDECVTLIKQRFPYIALPEIKEAYRLWAAGELDLKKGEAEMYGGQFNAAQIGKILGAYAKKRKAVIGRYLSAKEDAKREQEKNEVKERQKKYFYENFETLLNDNIQKAEDWRQVGEYFFNEAWRRKIITLTPQEQAEIKADAKALAEMEVQNEYAEAQGAANVFRIRELRKAVEDTAGLEARAKVIARKLTLFRKLKLRQ